MEIKEILAGAGTASDNFETPVPPVSTTIALNPSNPTTPTGSQTTTPSNNTVVAVMRPTTPQTTTTPTEKKLARARWR